jgi:uncharacterized protein YchJ
MQLPHFTFKEIEALYEYDLTIPDDLIDPLLLKDRELLIKDLEKLLQHAVDKFEVFNAPEVSVKNTFFVWHAMFLLKDLEATEALPAFIKFLQQDEDLVGMYLGDAITNFGWEVFYALGSRNLRVLVDFLKLLSDDYDYRMEIIEALKQIGFCEAERKLEIEAYFEELLLHAAAISNTDDAFIDEVLDKLLEAIGNLKLTRLYPEVKEILETGMLELSLVNSWDDFEDQYINTAPRKETTSTRKAIYTQYLEAQQEWNEEEDDDDDMYEDFDGYLDDIDKQRAYEDVLEEEEPEGELEDKDQSYIDYTEIRAPFIRKEPKVGRNEPCPCGSGKKYKNCHGKS